MADKSKVIQFKQSSDPIIPEINFNNLVISLNDPDKSYELKDNIIDFYLKEIPYTKYCSEDEVAMLKLWTKKLNKLYQGFASRHSIEKWSELLSDEVCKSDPTQAVAIYLIFIYIRNKFHISAEIMRYLDKELKLTDKKERLYDDFKKEFVDIFLITKLYEDDGLEVDRFTPLNDELDYDKYLNGIILLKRFWAEEDDINVRTSFIMIRSMEMDHPMLDDYEISYYISKNELDKAENLLNHAEEKYKDMIADGLLRFDIIRAELLFLRDKYDESKILCHKILDKNPKILKIGNILAEIYISEKEFEKAKDVLNLLGNLGYCNFKSLQMFKDISSFTKARDLSEMYEAKALESLSLKNYDEALEQIDAAIKILPERIYFKLTKINILVAAKRYEEAIEICDEAINKRNNPIAIYIKKELEKELNPFI